MPVELKFLRPADARMMWLRSSDTHREISRWVSASRPIRTKSSPCRRQGSGVVQFSVSTGHLHDLFGRLLDVLSLRAWW